jgi:hypothetical protein
MSTTITIAKATEIMREASYDDSQLARLTSWHENGRIILIFENHDLDHSDCGHKFAMPWDDAEKLPPHGPDHPSIGLGWRYLTTYVVYPAEKTVKEVV